MPLPRPRPTRLRLAVAPLGGRNVERLVDTLFFLCRNCNKQLLGFPGCESGSDHPITRDRRISRSQPHSTTWTRCGTFAIIPRTEGVSSRSTICCSRVKPTPLMTSLCFSVVHIFV